jgi:exosortase/archaeosortase family protein
VLPVQQAMANHGSIGPRVAALLVLYLLLHQLLDLPAQTLHLVALNEATADLALAWLAAAGVPLVREGSLVMHAQGFVTEVHQTCTALLPAALLLAAIALHHARPAQKLVGMLLGVGVVTLLNQCRLVGVIWVGVQAPALWPVVHGGLAPAAMVALTITYALAWARVVRRTDNPSGGCNVEG